MEAFQNFGWNWQRKPLIYASVVEDSASKMRGGYIRAVLTSFRLVNQKMTLQSAVQDLNIDANKANLINWSPGLICLKHVKSLLVMNGQ